jgi:acetyl esterase/lipase
MIEQPLLSSAYGCDAAQQLSLFAPPAIAEAPIMLFVGLAAADRDRIGTAMAAQGFVCAIMQHRAAPAHPYPAGPNDVAAAIGWLRTQVADHGGDPDRIVAVGHGSGALHLGGYIADEARHAAPLGGIAGAALLSGLYDPRSCVEDHGLSALFGDGWRTEAAVASLAGLLRTELPLLFTVGERDGADRQRQAAQLVGAWGLAHAAYPSMHLLLGHDHVSAIGSIGTADRRLEQLLVEFARRVAG